MRTVISVPSTSAASILLIPRVIPAAQQRSQTRRRAGQSGTATAGGAQTHCGCSRFPGKLAPVIDVYTSWQITPMQEAWAGLFPIFMEKTFKRPGKKRWSRHEAIRAARWFSVYLHAYSQGRMLNIKAIFYKYSHVRLKSKGIAYYKIMPPFLHNRQEQKKLLDLNMLLSSQSEWDCLRQMLLCINKKFVLWTLSALLYFFFFFIVVVV